LKHEVLSRHPGLRFAFSRPGLLTFKSEHVLTLAAPIESHLATLRGLSLGGVKTLADLPSWAQKIGTLGEAASLPPLPDPTTTALSAFAWPTEEDAAPASPAELLEAEEQAQRQLGLTTPTNPQLELGLLVPPSDHANYGYWLFARPTDVPLAPRKVVPPEGAPSRAYSKLVEALAYFGISLSAGDGALELGAAPGGATLALLERGLSVVAVDPAKMDPTLAPFAADRGLQLFHVEKPAQALAPSDLSALSSPVRWLISDMNLAPPVAVQQLLRARALVKKTLRGAILTLKLNDTAAVDTLPRVLIELERAFGRVPRVTHLPSHRREVVAVIGDV